MSLSSNWFSIVGNGMLKMFIDLVVRMSFVVCVMFLYCVCGWCSGYIVVVVIMWCVCVCCYVMFIFIVCSVFFVWC